jgi:uncharacterized protein (TIGR00255 family)
MIKSMTAFSRVEKSKNELTVSIEIRSYNSKYLDIALRLPYGYFPLEEKIKALISSRTARGRIELSAKITDDSDKFRSFEIDLPKARAYYDALELLKNQLEIPAEISLNHLLNQADIIKPAGNEKDLESDWELIKECIDEAIDGLDAMRKKEGDFIARYISERIDIIEKSIDQIEKESAGLISRYQNRLKERISVLTQNLVEIDPARIAQEAAFLADRSDISEEIVRVVSHINQFRAIMHTEEAAGRKLNFLLQEFNREFNTMGSKVGNAPVCHLIVELKSELEKIREQVQNIE